MDTQRRKQAHLFIHTVFQYFHPTFTFLFNAMTYLQETAQHKCYFPLKYLI